MREGVQCEPTNKYAIRLCSTVCEVSMKSCWITGQQFSKVILMGRSEVSTSVVKWCEGLRNRVSIIIRRYLGHMKFYCFFHIVLVLLCIIVYMVVCFVGFYLILYIMDSNWYVYVFLLLCMFRSRYCVSLCCSVYCLCVNVYYTTANGCQPNWSYKIYHISYIKFCQLCLN
jgi:hypothetical protein